MGWEGPLTHKQHLVWQAWRNLQWNIPDRHDHYSMGIMAMWGSKDSKLDDFRIKFLDRTIPSRSPRNPGAEEGENGEAPFGPKRLTKETLAAAQSALTKGIWAWRCGALQKS